MNGSCIKLEKHLFKLMETQALTEEQIWAAVGRATSRYAVESKDKRLDSELDAKPSKPTTEPILTPDRDDEKRIPAYFTPKQFVARHSWIRMGGLRELLFNRDYNGLSKSGSIIALNRKILIDETKFIAWIETYRSKPGARKIEVQ